MYKKYHRRREERIQTYKSNSNSLQIQTSTFCQSGAMSDTSYRMTAEIAMKHNIDQRSEVKSNPRLTYSVPGFLYQSTRSQCTGSLPRAGNRLAQLRIV